MTDEVKEILDSTISASSTVSLTMDIYNPNDYHVTVKLYLQITKIQTNEHKTLVISTDGAKAATPDGKTVPTHNKTIAVNPRL